jgi:uncharacterized RDD family membrane protein YckC
MICLTDEQIWEATVTTPENPTPDDSAPENPGGPAPERDPAAPADPQQALRGLGEQPRIDEQGYPTAYTAVPPPLSRQLSGQPGQPGDPGHPEQPGRSQQPEQPWQGGPAWQNGQSAQNGHTPQYGRSAADGAAGGHAPSPFGASYGRQEPANQGVHASAQQPGGPSDQPPPGYGGYPPPGERRPGSGQPGTGYPGESGQGPYPGGPQQPGARGPEQGYGYPPPPGYESYGPQYGGGRVPGMPPFASWGQRAGAWLIDNFVAVVGISILDAAYYNWSYGVRAFAWVLMAVGVLWSIYNAYLAGQSGQSTGKRLAGIRLARYVDGQVVGPAFGILRLFLNAVFWAICVIPGIFNYLWPLWDRRAQTWSDKIASSVVVRTR